MNSFPQSALRLQNAVVWASRGLIERAPLVEAVVLGAVAGEHLLVVGPPGTAKSQAVRRIASALGGRYFEYLLGRFSEPSEIFGPVDLRRLREGVVQTQTDGMLPEADIAFLDEVFQGSTAILNTLLGLLNERVFRRGHDAIWLLAEDAPLEFLRRLSQNESAFLQLARRDPFGARSCVALLDVSPETLGGPRLASFAALLVLARRAQTAGASFRWGAWQMPGKWQVEVNRESVEWWLKLRGQGEANEEQRAGWEDVWHEEQADFSRDELWLVGGAGLKTLAPKGARVLEVRDELDPLAPDRAVLARVDGRELRLVLPEDAIGARLIRDPFAHAAPLVTNEKNTFDIGRPNSNFVWASSGFKGFLRVKGGALFVFSIPNSPAATVGPPKVLRASNPDVVAAGRVGRMTVVASLSEGGPEHSAGELVFESRGRGSTSVPNGLYLLNAPLNGLERQAARCVGLGRIFPLGAGGTLAVSLSTHRLAVVAPGEETVRLDWQGVVEVVVRDGALSLLRDTKSGFSFEIITGNNGRIEVSREKIEVPSPLFKPPLCGWGGHPNTPLWALDVGNYLWQLRLPELELEVRADANERRQVLGCIARSNTSVGWPDIGLLVTQDRREIWFRGRGEDALVCRFPSTFEHVAVCPFAPLIAVQGEHELGIYSLQHNVWLLKAHWD